MAKRTFQCHFNHGVGDNGAADSQSPLEKGCEALSCILVFWAALGAKPDILTYHVVLHTVFNIGLVFGLTDKTYEQVLFV